MDQKQNEDMIKKAVEQAAMEAEKASANEEVEVVDDKDVDVVTEDNLDEEGAVAEEASEEVESAEGAEASEGEAKESKKFFRKKPKQDKKDEQIAELKDRVTRQMAEFDNFRKRSEKEKTARYELGAKSVIEKILPIVDNFERGFETLTEEQRKEPFVDGIDKTYKQLITTLSELGVEPIVALGEPFDPEKHHAVMHEEDENYGENTISEELLKGYTYRDQVVRHSMVKVVN